MSDKRVRCPACSKLLLVPGDYKGTKVKCGICLTGFRIPGISDADVLDWIGKRDRDDTSHGAKVQQMLDREVGQAIATAEKPEDDACAEGGCYAGRDGFYLQRIDRKGALFQIDAKLLKDRSFRGAMPRSCMRCGTKSHIQPHLLILTHQMLDCATLETEYVGRRIELADADIRDKSREELLKLLPDVNRVHPPANLPMPYWVCDMCSPSDLIFAQSEIRRDGTGHWHLQIFRLWRALEFIARAGGAESEAYETLKKEIEGHEETPWDQLPGVVQQRLQQWYRPHKGERFVAYMPLRSRARTEKGMAGVLVSNRRMIYHSSMRHRESDKGEPLELDFGMNDGQLRLHMKGPNWEIKNMVVDKPGLEILRKALRQEKFQAIWH